MITVRHNIIWFLNLALALLIGILIIAAVLIYTQRDNQLQQPSISPRSEKLPASSFEMPKANYNAIDQPSLKLKMQIPQIRVPDLRSTITFHGQNTRPDAGAVRELFFSLGRPQEMQAIKPGEAIYLKLNEDSRTYIFSPGNYPTDLWFEAKMQGPQASLKVKVKDEAGQIQMEPKERSQFLLQEKPLALAANPWNLDKWRVDGSLLARQHARWSGRDLFLEEHGGEENQQYQGKQRITFGEGDEIYSVYVDKGDSLIWREGKWQWAVSEEESRNYPLMRLNKLEERLIGFELFDLGGKKKLTLNMIKTQDPLPTTSVLDDFQFVGARTRIHSMFRIQKERVLVGPEDWFLLTSEGWKKLKSGKEIDQYVEGKLVGPLLVIDRIEQQNEDRWLAASLFNSSRSQSVDIEIPLRVGQTTTQMIRPAETKEANEEEAPQGVPVGIPKG